MTIEITKPEVEAIINARLESGLFEDAEDVVLQALQASPAKPAAMPMSSSNTSPRTLKDMFEGAKGLADDVDFSRNPAYGRPVNLS